MTRFFIPLVYILGFSVFCACTTTRVSPVDELDPSDDPRNLNVTLIDGSQLRVHSATVTATDIRGLILRNDTSLVPVSPRMDIVVNCLQDPESEDRFCRIAVPRSDAALVQIKEPDRVATGIGIAVSLAVLIGLVVVGRGLSSGLCC